VVIAVLVLILACGVLKGFDPLLNLVLDGTTEHLRGTAFCALQIDDIHHHTTLVLSLLNVASFMLMHRVTI